jgi:hypothetical protein
MGNRDMGKKETKKGKKDGKKSITGGGMEALPPVEVIRRGKKDKSE